MPGPEYKHHSNDRDDHQLKWNHDVKERADVYAGSRIENREHQWPAEIPNLNRWVRSRVAKPRSAVSRKEIRQCAGDDENADNMLLPNPLMITRRHNSIIHLNSAHFFGSEPAQVSGADIGAGTGGESSVKPTELRRSLGWL
jgi:hypothetical protein